MRLVQKRFSLLLAALILAASLFACAPSAIPEEQAVQTPGAPLLLPTPDTSGDTSEDVSAGMSADVPVPDEEEPRTLVRFEDMLYERPQAEKIARMADALTARLPSIKSLDELKPLFDEVDALYSGYDAMHAIAMIRASMDRSVGYWTEEERVLTEGYPTLKKASGALMVALYESPLRTAIESEWDAGFFDYIENAYFTNDITKPLFEREAQLESEQKDRLALATVTFRGKTLTYADIFDITDYYDWMEASKLWYAEYNGEFAGRYVELVKTRNAIAKALGFENYAAYALQYERKDYSPSQMQKLVDSIAGKLTPLLKKAQLGGRYMPDIEMSYEEYLDFLEKIFVDMRPAWAEVLTAMREYNLSDMEPRAHKEYGAFTMYIADYDVPFMLGSYTEDMYSMTTVAHEFGHFYNGFASVMDPPANNDLCEVHSQGMELFVSNHYAEVFGDGIAYQMRYDTMYKFLATIVGQPFYTSFELRAYALEGDALTVDALNKIAYEESIRFGLDGYFPEYGMYDWATLPHIFERPFSTFGYVTSAIAALELWEVAQEDEAAALTMYDRLMRQEGDGEFIDVLRAAGLKSPFDEGMIEKIAAWAQKTIIEGEL